MTDLQFAPLVLGGNVFGWTADRDASFAVLDAFVAAGGRSIDTADVYSEWAPGHSGGESEAVLGEWLESRGARDRVEIATKVSAKSDRPGLAPDNVRAAVDESLRRLRTDRIDLYYAHRDDEQVPQEDVLGVFSELVSAGKVREIGASNFAPARLRTAAAIASAEGLTGFTVSQDRYNLVERAAEIDLLPTLAELGIAEVPYAGLAGGFLTGKYRAGAAVDSPRAGGAAKYLDEPRNADLLDALGDVAADRAVPVAAVAIAWLAAQPGVAAPIVSARSPEQLADVLQAVGLELTPTEIEQISSTTEPVAA